ncbi:FHA domain-containing protein [Myxococcaceae bacterium JPH2]|nr:FHA domain-containing protein [Myxococcaceae bacterium JPH2]
MSNGSPPARRRPTSGTPSGGTGQRPAARRPASGASGARPSAAPRSSPRLVVTAGPKEGEEFVLDGTEYVIGRSTDNPICIADTSVSRRHISVRNDGSGWMVSDLGSGNGTMVNGEPISEETLLANGDTITLGDTELSFQDAANSTAMVAPPAPSRPRPTAGGRPAGGVPPRPGARPEGRVRPQARGTNVEQLSPEAQRKRTRLKLLAAGVVVVLFAGLGVVRMRVRQQESLEAQRAMAEKGRREELSSFFQDAKNLVREGRWQEARTKLEELQAQAPDYPGVADYLKAADKEIPNQTHLTAVTEAVKKGELAKATAELAKVGSDTQLYEQVKTARKSLVEAADKRAREARALQDSKALENMEKAKAITDDVLAAFPEHRDAKLINDEAVVAIRIAKEPKPTGPVITPKPWEPAVDRFRDGDLSGAVAILNACSARQPRCKGLMGQMTEFGGLYKKLEDLDAKGLSRLLSLDKDITDGKGSKMARNAGTRAATIFYKSASAAKASGQWARAMEYARKALQADPGHAGASNIVNDLKTKARDLYLQAYSIKDSSPEDALPKFKDVVSMTPADDEFHTKAQGWVEKLSR